jgi:hypothetical protein
LSNRFTASLIKDGTAVKIKCPNVTHDFVHCSNEMSTAAQMVGIIDANVAQEMKPSWNALIKDKKRHDHEFILDFKQMTVNVDEQNLPIMLMSFHNSVVRKTTMLTAEVYEFDIDEVEQYHDPDTGDVEDIPEERMNICYKLAFVEPKRRLIDEGNEPAAENLSGPEIYERMKQQREQMRQGN